MDTVVLGALWGLTMVIPDTYEILPRLPCSTVLKIAALMGTLEALGFMAFHLMGARAGLLVRGFFGGFVSSTGTFLLFTRSETYDSFTAARLTQALLLATIAMLIECLFILFTVIPKYALGLGVPIFIQLGLLILSVLVLGLKKSSPSKAPLSIQIEELVIWKNVVKFTLFMVSLIFLMRLIQAKTSLPYTWTTLTLSLFEAHAVLAAAMSEQSHDHSASYKLILMVLSGNVLSKSFLVWKSRRLRGPVLIPLFSSLFIVWAYALILEGL